jgi:hypothetical protein
MDHQGPQIAITVPADAGRGEAALSEYQGRSRYPQAFHGKASLEFQAGPAYRANYEYSRRRAQAGMVATLT